MPIASISGRKEELFLSHSPLERAVLKERRISFMGGFEWVNAIASFAVHKPVSNPTSLKGCATYTYNKWNVLQLNKFRGPNRIGCVARKLFLNRPFNSLG